MFEDNYKHRGMRRQLAKKLIEKGITDKNVINAIEKVPRHIFFDKAFVEQAYKDIAFPIGEGQTISQPYTVAFQSQHLEICKGNKILEIGTGSGYQSCILMELGAKVYSIEKNKKLFEKVTRILPALGYDVKFFLGDGTLGISQFAPYDRIIVTAGSPRIPQSLMDQLANGGIMIVPVGNENVQKMVKIKKSKLGILDNQELGDFRFVPLLGKEGWDEK